MTTTQVISPLETVIARLEATGREWTERPSGWFETSCPVQHNHKGGDGNPHSLHFKETALDTDQDDTTVFFNCFSGGCSRYEIIKALGLKDNDLYSKPDSLSGLAAARYSKIFENALTVHQYARDKKLPDDYLMYELGITEGVFTFHKKDGTPFKLKAMATPYYRSDGSLFEAFKLRTALKKEGKFSIHLWTEGDEEHITYGEDKIHQMIEAGYGIIDEGESDTQTLWFHGYPALGIPGATNVESTLDPSLLIDVPKLYVIQEKTDQAGQNFPFRVKKHLESAGYKGEILRVPLKTLTEAKDPSELHQLLWDKNDPKGHERFRKEFQKCLDQAKPMDTNTAMSELEVTEALLCSFTDDDAGNGDAMEALHGQDFLYCPSRGWLYYVDTHWKLDPDGAEVKKKAVSTLRARRHAAVELEKESVVKCTKAEDKRVNGCINRFRTLVNASIDEFDNNPDMLNCKNGVVDLRTGLISPHSREQRFTYCIPVAYNPEATCQEWLDYLSGVVGGGQAVIDYLQLALGYSMTGHTREEILFYLFGPPRSGKGTISEIFMSLMPSPISTGVDFNSFTARREGDVSNFDLAPLKASRLIFASESLRGQSLNPAKIKQLTGGDRVRACFKHKDFFEYRPQFKVWMLSNWPVNGDPEDDALWGRVRVIEFPNSFLGNEDKTKKSKLQEHDALEAILAWGVKGARDWYALGSKGLTTPDAVKNVTQKQRAELDYVQQWLDDCCEAIEEAKDCWEANEDVSKSYTDWCKNNNVQFPKSARGLALSLQAKGLKTGVARKIDGKTKKGVEGLYIYNKVQQRKDSGIG